MIHPSTRLGLSRLVCLLQRDVAVDWCSATPQMLSGNAPSPKIPPYFLWAHGSFSLNSICFRDLEETGLSRAFLLETNKKTNLNRSRVAGNGERKARRKVYLAYLIRYIILCIFSWKTLHSILAVAHKVLRQEDYWRKNSLWSIFLLKWFCFAICFATFGDGMADGNLAGCNADKTIDTQYCQMNKASNENILFGLISRVISWMVPLSSDQYVFY